MEKPSRPPWYRRIGPGLITACVVIGPGSVLTSSRVGAEHGYAMNWVVIVAVVCMLVYTGLGAKLGAVTSISPGTLVAQRAGRPLAMLIGLSVFLISALFQYGNNMGAHAAFNTYLPFPYWIVVFNALSLAFLFGFRNLYKAIERLMMLFVALMLLSFAANLVLAGPNLGALFGGFLPRWSNDIDINLLGLVGTTFVISAAFLQPYLVQQKGWGKEDVQQGLIDARIGAVIMALITLMIVSTSATVFHPDDAAAARQPEDSEASQTGETPLDEAPAAQPVKLESVGHVAQQLRPLLGDWGQLIFCIGLFSAAYSSFLVNSMIGGFILSDGLGLGSDPHHRWPRLCTAAVLLVGMGVALYSIRTGTNPVPAIVMAQALVVVASPLVAGVLLWLTNLPSIMGADRNRPLTNVLAGLAFAMLLAMAYYLAAYKIPEQLWPPPPHYEAEQLPASTVEPFPE